MGESLKELQKQKEDIEILLSTLEEAYSDASITEEHYNEVKGKNQKKLEELNKKLEELEKKGPGPSKEEPAKEEAAPEPKADEKPKKAKAKKGRPKKAKTDKTPSEPSPPTTPPSTPPATPDKPPSGGDEGGATDYSGIPQPLTDIAGEGDAAEASPDKAPGVVRTAAPGTLQYTAEEVKEMLNKVLKEIRPQGLEVAPRVDKLEVQIEKLRAYIEAMKDERSGGKENIQRLTEEMGELRSNVAGVDRKVSESEMKVQEIDQALGDLRPARFLKSLQEEDKSLKIHDARLDKLDDLTSVMLKKLGQIEEVLKRLGSLEKIVNFSKEAAKRLLEIENREKKINRIADKIDGIFMELNKRLDEFVLYKAKQDTLDELSQEMMKSLDEMSTKMEKYAEKGDMDMLKEMFQTEIASLRTGAGASPEVQKLESQKAEIEGLIAMLDEQFKAKALPEKEYQKTKAINEERLRDIEKKLGQAKLGTTPAPSPEEWADKAKSPGAEQPAPEGGPKTQEKPGEKSPGAKETPGEKPTPTQKDKAKEKPQTKPDEALKEKPGEDKKKDMLSDLEDSLMKGLISKEAYEKTKKLIKDEKEK